MRKGKRLVLGVLALALPAGCSRAGAGSPEGATLFATYCSRCHGLEGKGGLSTDAGSAPRNFRDPSFHKGRTDADLRATIEGGRGTVMPPFRGLLQPAQLDALVQHLRSLDPGRSSR